MIKINSFFDVKFFYILSLTVFSFFIILGIASVVVGTTTLDLNPKVANIIFKMSPQGWGFFTKNPKEELMFVYKLSSENKWVFQESNNFSYKNLYGLKRQQRMEQIKYFRITGSINSEKWSYCKNSEGLSCYSKDTIILDSNLYFNIDKGIYKFVMQPPIPWAWAKNKKTLKSPTKSVICELK